MGGIASGSFYALIAVGLVLVFRTTRHINFSQGELYMLGGYLTYSGYVTLGLPYPVAICFALVVAFLVGIVSDKLIYRPLIKSPELNIVLATVGLSFFIKGIARWVWGGKGDYVTFPMIVDAQPISVLGAPVLPQQVIVLSTALVTLGLIGAFFRWTIAGKTMKATSENPHAAYLVGIRVERVYKYTWAASAVLAALAGCVAAPLTLLSPDIGVVPLLKAFAAIVLGGLGSVIGAIIGGLAVGIIESLAGGYIATGFQDVSAFVVIMAVLVVKPYGFFSSGPHRKV